MLIKWQFEWDSSQNLALGWFNCLSLKVGGKFKTGKTIQHRVNVSTLIYVLSLETKLNCKFIYFLFFAEAALTWTSGKRVKTWILSPKLDGISRLWLLKNQASWLRQCKAGLTKFDCFSWLCCKTVVHLKIFLIYGNTWSIIINTNSSFLVYIRADGDAL